MKNKIIDFFKIRYPEHDIDPVQPFADYGIDSLEILEVLMDLEEELDLSFPDEKLVEWKILQDVLDYVKGCAKINDLGLQQITEVD